MKRIVPVAAAALALTLSACGGQSNGAGGGDTTISFAFWGSNDEAATLKAMVAAFEKANPHIDVKENWIQSDYEQNLQVSIAGQKAPTVSEISNTSLAGFAGAYDKADVDPSSYYSSNIAESMKLDGSYWAV